MLSEMHKTNQASCPLAHGEMCISHDFRVETSVHGVKDHRIMKKMQIQQNFINIQIHVHSF